MTGDNIIFFPAVTLEDVESMDIKEIVEGYGMGLKGDVEPSDSRAKWHGWKNGMVDSGRRDKDEWQAIIVKKMVDSWGKR